MEKYLRQQRKIHNKGKIANGQVRSLRVILENSGKITTEELKSALQEDKVMATREVLFFKKYQDHKKIIHRYLTLKQIQEHRELVILLDENSQQYEKKVKKESKGGVNNKEVNQKKEEKWDKQKIVKIVSIIMGIFFFVLAVVKRKQLVKIVKKILV